MANNKMLIDAAHPEETRVVVLRGDKVEEFDFEAADRQQLRGNIYLAKVTRVEPSLQAAFVDYGGNRHGFLAFSEIHPDYYQIPVADRQALLAEQAQEEAREAAEEMANGEAAEARAEAAEPGGANGEDNGDADAVENVGAEDALEEVPERRKAPRPRQYKIQEVIKRRQVMLVQVVKEERGSKGAALTTYLSLAGRYSVLMPNTARGGGISRKITNPADRKRLKEVAAELDVPEGMGVILRTAGANRTKAEVKRDFEYLLRLWENVRELTLRSTAPTLVYEEGSLVKRSIRDLYSREIDTILVAGEEGYREAKDFMRMLMPSHAKNVQPYRDKVPIFSRYGVEAQLDSMFSPVVTLKSGGYVVLNQTEALVAIDVNSGRSTREHSIEDTALRTNQEAAEEIARQLRLRDLAGLIVIDFIDMEESRHNAAVERKLKEAMRHDRARIQIGRISAFGLLELSRQRMRPSLFETSTEICQHCRGTGHVRSTESTVLHVLRWQGPELDALCDAIIALSRLAASLADQLLGLDPDPPEPGLSSPLRHSRRRERVQVHIELEVVHGALADVFGGVCLRKQTEKAQNHGAQISDDHEVKPVNIPGRDVTVDGDFRDVGSRQLCAGVKREKKQRQRQQLPIRPQVAKQPPHQPRIVSFPQDLVFGMARLVHARSSARFISSTSRAKRWL